MHGLSAAELAVLAGVTEAEVGRLVDLGSLVPGTAPARAWSRRPEVRLATACQRAGLPMAGIAAAIRAGRLSFAFLEAASSRRWAVRSARTYRQVSQETGMPLELLGSFPGGDGFAPMAPRSRSGRTSWRWCRCCGSGCPAASWIRSGRPGSAVVPPRVWV